MKSVSSSASGLTRPPPPVLSYSLERQPAAVVPFVLSSSRCFLLQARTSAVYNRKGRCFSTALLRSAAGTMIERGDARMSNGARTGCDVILLRSCYAATDYIFQLLVPVLLREATTCSCYDDACRTDESMNEGKIGIRSCSSKLYKPLDHCVINVHVYGILGTRELE